MTYKYDDEDLANTVLAIADDYLAEHTESAETYDVYDWLVAQSAKIRFPFPIPGASA